MDGVKRRFVYCLLLLTLGCSKPKQWKEYSYLEGGFAISSPIQPRVEKPSSVRTDYVIDFLDGKQFSVMYVELLEAPASEAIAKANMDKLAGYISRDAQGKVTMKDIVFAGKPGKSFVIVNGPLTVQGRCYQSEARMYALTSKGSPPPPDTDRFFNSFRILQ
jgi:hypothetical protein